MPQTLLLADDSVTIQRVIELTFADEDINVFAVSDGDQAIEKIDADPPDIVLVDVGMPGRSGFEVARHIKTSPRLQHIPVLLLTGAFEPVDEATAASAGCAGVLAKPFEPQLVISRVMDLLGRSGASTLGDSAPALDHPVATDLAPTAQSPDVWGEQAAAPPADAVRPAQVARLDSYFAKLDEAFSSLGGSAPAASVPSAAADQSPIADMIDWFGAKRGGAPAPLPESPVAEAPAAATVDVPAPVEVAEPVFHADPLSDPDLAQFVDSMPPYRESVPEYSAPEPRHHEAPEAPEAPEVLEAPEARSESFEPTPQYVAPAAAASWEAPAASMAVAAPPAPATLPPLADAFAAILASEQHEPIPAAAPAWPGTAASTAAHADGVLTEEGVEMITRRVLERLSDRVVRETVADLVSAVAERLVREEIERIKASMQ